ncbi:AraC family transcriptional regulator [Sanyastnella coralliicola]|uniref:AraC family transcriptional regulator n=1 Tax=Sanyastnella coralliicola TaxID=3069118 RepID=UPI0027BA13DF|nr:helix-turn-helix domain-containing protein [Longitalea sp. SCSIO 12813]
MHFSFLHPVLKGEFLLSKAAHDYSWTLINDKKLISILWNRGNETAEFEIDGVKREVRPGQIMSLTYFHKVKALNTIDELVLFSFNREFYCIYDHDHEVSCNGIIFFGAQELPIVDLDEVTANKLELLLQVFIDEFETPDGVQGEMLVMLLKRLIILCTRVARKQIKTAVIEEEKIDLIREFNFLVDMKFREKKTVAEYAEALFKSPKTLSNIFRKNGLPSPLHVIHERIVLEAKRLLTYTDKNVTQIAYELGYDDPVGFSRTFKKVTGVSPQQFKEQKMTA